MNNRQTEQNPVAQTGGADPGGDVILKARSLQKSYWLIRKEVQVLREIDMTVRRGETVSIMGASGAGKSTLLHVLGGLDKPSSGQVFFRGADVYRMKARRRSSLRARHIGFVFQAYHLLPELDVLENIMLPAMTAGHWTQHRSAAQQHARELLARVGLESRKHHLPAELSGGEQQRAALARALMNDPDIVFCDEPTGNLDSKTGEQVLHYLFELIRETGHTLILVSHNKDVAACCDRMLYLQDGRLEDGT
jgi:predicted ABC-type transport system involved in lysophospholipase L1 biosynthesis ATPase subunit